MLRRLTFPRAKCSGSVCPRLYSYGRGTTYSSSSLLKGLQDPPPYRSDYSGQRRGGSTTSHTKDSFNRSPLAKGREDAPPNPSSRATDAVNHTENAVHPEKKSEDEFRSIRQHKFFKLLLSRVERELPSVESDELYSQDTMNTFVRPLLQWTDKALTAEELQQLVPKINSLALENTLRSSNSQRTYQLFFSKDHRTVLDWSMEDFLRRRYQSIHLSWEPMQVVARRLGWDENTMSNTDVLLYFSKFDDLVELARLEVVGGKPKALPIRNSLELARRGGIPLSRLLIHRKPAEETEPSLTESVRLMGSPSLSSPSKSKRSRRNASKDSVTAVFDAIEGAACQMTNEEDMDRRLEKAANVVQPTTQAQYPSGRIVKEFSIGKFTGKEGEAENREQDTNANKRNDVESSTPTTFNQYEYDTLCGLYHRRKVETALLRRRINTIGDSAQVANLQERLSAARKELNSISEELKQMRNLKRSSVNGSTSDHFTDEDPKQSASIPKNDDAAAESVSKEEGSSCSPFSHDTTCVEQSPAHLAPLNDDDEYETSFAPEISTEEKDSVAAELAAHAIREFEEDEEELTVVEPRQIPLEYRRTLNGSRHHDTRRVVTVKEEDNEDASAMEELRQAEEELEAETEGDDSPAAHEITAEQEIMSFVDDADAVDEGEKVEALKLLQQKEKKLLLKVEAMQRKMEETTRQWKDLEKKMSEELTDFEKKLENLRLKEEELLLKEKFRNKDAGEKKMSCAAAEEEHVDPDGTERAQDEMGERRLETALQEVEKAAKDSERKQEAKTTHAGKSAEVKVNQRGGIEELHKGRVEESQKASGISEPAEVPLSTHRAASNYEVSDFICTPEQYDGLHFASKRLQREIAILEKQMEDGDAEEDETLMIILAASRAELEEMEECIRSVQEHADWAASSDAAREQAEAERIKNLSPAARKVQDDIDEQQFNLSLLEKRLNKAAQRGVITKLEQNIIQTRRELNRLRREQDRLRRGGEGEAFPVSVAETLNAEDVRRAEEDDTEMREMIEATTAAAGNPPEEDTHLSASDASEREGIGRVDAAAGNEDVLETSNNDINTLHYEKELNEITSGLFSNDSGYESNASFTDAQSSDALNDADDNLGYEEAEKLKHHLDNMVRDIQSLQETIQYTEGESDPEVAVVLVDLKEKLQQLHQIRMDVEQRLAKVEGRSASEGSQVSSAVLRQHVRPVTVSTNSPPVIDARPLAKGYPQGRQGRRQVSRS